jgi:IS30 family transposase
MTTANPMNSAKKAIIWREWKKGIPMSVICRLIEKPSATVFSYLRYHGGIEPRRRNRRPSALSMLERESISRGLAVGISIRAIASSLGRSPSTVSREVSKNGGFSRYRATEADQAARKRARRPKTCLLVSNAILRTLVTEKLAENWSPEQISGWLRLTYADSSEMHVSHETIYKSLFIQTRDIFKKELRKHLRTGRKFRHSRTHRAGYRQKNLDGFSINERPAFVEDRVVPGHWEGDLICGTGNSYIATVVERQTRFTLLVKVASKETKSVISALSQQMNTLPTALKQSLTWDRGTEMMSHRDFSAATKIDVYFCDPQSPWQRGTNENTNGLLRQYFPKGSCLSNYSQNDLNEVAERLNNRPRKTLAFHSPADRLTEVLS